MSEQLISEAVSYPGVCPQTVDEILADCGVRLRRPTAVPFLWTPRHRSDEARWDKFWSDANIHTAFAEAQDQDQEKDHPNEVAGGDGEDGQIPTSEGENLVKATMEGLETEFKIETAGDRVDLLSEGLVEIDHSEEVRFEEVSAPFVKSESVIDFVVS